MLTKILRPNNFDILRILAATQVLITHSASHLGVNIPPALLTFLEKFPGVPIFFVISGFLISASFEKTPNLKIYFTNRALRIFPALWVCLIVSITSAIIFGGISFFRWDAVPWLAAQVSFLQFYNPDFLRGYGTGVLNGSLWTIAVELEFYILLPILYYLFKTNLSRNMSFTGLFIVFIMIAFIISQLTLTHDQYYLLEVSLFPHLYMFLMGILLQRMKIYSYAIIFSKGLYWLAAYLLFSYLIPDTEFKIILSRIILGITTVSIAYSWTSLSKTLLKENDISYGVYIYHMVFVNIFVQMSFMHNTLNILWILVLTFVAAFLSWRLVEKPALNRKRVTLKSRK